MDASPLSPPPAGRPSIASAIRAAPPPSLPKPPICVSPGKPAPAAVIATPGAAHRPRRRRLDGQRRWRRRNRRSSEARRVRAPRAVSSRHPRRAGTPLPRPASLLAVAPPLTHPQQEISIVSPTPRSTILLDPETALDRQRVQLRASALGLREPPSSLVRRWRRPWRAPGGQPLWCAPTPGLHELRVIDLAGNADHLTLTVARP